MNQVQMIALLNTLSVPSFYGQAPVGTALPFITIHSEQPDNFVADNFVYCALSLLVYFVFAKMILKL